PCHVPSDMLFLRDIRLEGYFMSRQLKKLPRAEQLEIYAHLAGLVANGTLAAQIAATYSLDSVIDAVRHAGRTGGDREGKIIMVPNRQE
ncbi:MAG TPA: alcohol dehydrogenase, partial [Alphaproteobacteria bacterium]|nr:alcohol dehydrogenase [Alphaproteobacteria bacterium]